MITLKSVLKTSKLFSSANRFFSNTVAHRNVLSEKNNDFHSNPQFAQELQRLKRQRNIGISAHIDSGKTTVTERVLFYTGRIDSIHEVRGKDEIGAKMDFMELEREKGITIQSAATFCHWKDYFINVIDTPGHIDFTIEVERALRVLDGAILVVCAVSGVQSQTMTVDRQMKRYEVPRITFINKMDRDGANPFKIVEQIRNKLKMECALMQIPIGTEKEFKGVVDLIKNKAYYFEGHRGTDIVQDRVPLEMEELANKKKKELIESLSNVDEIIAEKYINEEDINAKDIVEAVTRATVNLKFSPVYLGSAVKDKGIQPVLDAVCEYLPNPIQVKSYALDTLNNNSQVELKPLSYLPLVALAFKLEDGRYGQLTYMRVYQGKIERGSTLYHVRTRKKIKVSRLVRMHANEMEEIKVANSGEICALFGIECLSGDTFTDSKLKYTMSSMHVPEPVISFSLVSNAKKNNNEFQAKLSKALNKFTKEDPTFRVSYNSESKQTILSGMGELHLSIYLERIRREYNLLNYSLEKPIVAYREAITKRVDFNHTHKKQTGGAGQFARVVGYIEPIKENYMELESESNSDKKEDSLENEFVSKIVGGTIPSCYIPACEKGFNDILNKGPLVGHKVKNCRVVLTDGLAHSVDSSELAFRISTVNALKQAFLEAEPILLEPIMKVDLIAPIEFQGTVLGSINKKNGVILDTKTIDGEFFNAIIEAPLNKMFGYTTDLRALTQGKGEFTMEFLKYLPVPKYEQESLVEKNNLEMEQKSSK